MKPELLYLVCAALLTALMWLPYILDRIAVRGLADTVGYPENPKPQSPLECADIIRFAHGDCGFGFSG